MTICSSFAENCKGYYFSFKLPNNIKFTSQDVTNFTTDLYPDIMKYAYTFGNGGNLIISASNDSLIDHEYSAIETLTMLKTTFGNDKNASFTVIYGDNKNWAYARSTNNGTGGRWTDDGKVKTTRGYFVTANGSDDISVILTAPATSYNNYESTIIQFVKSITFSGKKSVRTISNEVTTLVGNNTDVKNNPGNSGNNNPQPNPNPKPEVPRTPVTPPTPLSNKLYLEAYPQGESAIRSAEMYLYKSGVTILEKINNVDDASFDFCIYKDKKFYSVISSFPETLKEKDEELCWVVNKNKVDNCDIIILMRGNRSLDNSWMIPIELFKKQATQDKDNYRLDFNLKPEAIKVLDEYRDTRKVFEPLKDEVKPAQPSASVPATTPATQVDKK